MKNEKHENRIGKERANIRWHRLLVCLAIIPAGHTVNISEKIGVPIQETFFMRAYKQIYPTHQTIDEEEKKANYTRMSWEMSMIFHIRLWAPLKSCGDDACSLPSSNSAHGHAAKSNHSISD